MDHVIITREMDRDRKNTLAHLIHSKIQDSVQDFDYRKITNIQTDVDHFPYSRHFRGRYDDPNPKVWAREAGYRPIMAYVDCVCATPMPSCRPKNLEEYIPTLPTGKVPSVCPETGVLSYIQMQ